ncbi:NAD(P)/FAD-dependent oxidoreductase [Streptomyces cavernicola]|uniref:FAD-dependent oxidoreductase n=1 Tax=Streptomyces cavernicola TaxID=3043613 RepID=A0ABT6S5C3_9ACTN|nr:FAD-dependent oxidoreductase [Streptomyces sp. B-S-A6]MDI3403285.1 FAD-dependent oxidoreductase [Streptomyces sp. B-S-A6]
MKTPTHAGVVIVGAGQAGATCAALLRRYGYDRPVTLVGEEDTAPYHRPPLTKKWLAGGADDELPLRAETFYDDQGITLLTGTRVNALELGDRRILLADGTALPFEHLVLATGAGARRLPLPGADLCGVHHLRDRRDAAALRQDLARSERLVVIGGGYLGLEAAATARILGVDVEVVEGSERLLSRAASALVSEAVARLHRERGVVLYTGAQVKRLRGTAGRVTGVELGDGRVLACDTVLVAIGAVPNDALGRAAGLACEGGILVDAAGRTADPAVHAIGDVTVRPVPGQPGRRRVESVANANEQADQVAAAVCGRPVPQQSAPSFWSDQYDTKIQIVGMSGEDDAGVVRGTTATGSFAVFHLDSAGRLTSVEAIASPREAMAGKRWLNQGAHPDPLELGDLGVPLAKVRTGPVRSRDALIT